MCYGSACSAVCQIPIEHQDGWHNQLLFRKIRNSEQDLSVRPSRLARDAGRRVQGDRVRFLLMQDIRLLFLLIQDETSRRACSAQTRTSTLHSTPPPHHVFLTRPMINTDLERDSFIISFPELGLAQQPVG